MAAIVAANADYFGVPPDVGGPPGVAAFCPPGGASGVGTNTGGVAGGIGTATDGAGFGMLRVVGATTPMPSWPRWATAHEPGKTQAAASTRANQKSAERIAIDSLLLARTAASLRAIAPEMKR
jgi:hypothetical protein